MTGRQRTPGRDRVHLSPGRERQMKIRYTEVEFQAIAEAARHAGLTASGYAAEAALAAAREVDAPSVLPLRTALVEVMAARSQVRRFAVNVNQAVAALHATGQPPEWLSAAVAITTRAVIRLDDVADALGVAARRPSRRRTPASAAGSVLTARRSVGATPDPGRDRLSAGPVDGPVSVGER